jgi:hypothetical protein
MQTSIFSLLLAVRIFTFEHPVEDSEHQVKNKIVHSVDEDGVQRWFDEDGELHREDGPAIIFSDGLQAWYKHGKPHRKGGPAVIQANGTKEWYLNGHFQRREKP